MTAIRIRTRRWRVLMAIGWFVAGLLVAALLWVFSVAVFNPPLTPYFFGSDSQQTSLRKTWVPLEAVPAHVSLAVVAAEDQRFPLHRGVDGRELRKVLDQVRRDGLGGARGASTITQQTVKNVFLWHGRDPLRKLLELPLALLVDAAWGKSRVLEVYLNVAEMGPAVFGIEAAAQHHFGKSAELLTVREAALIAAVLPAPAVRDPARPDPLVTARAAWIERQMRQLGSDWLAGVHTVGETR